MTYERIYEREHAGSMGTAIQLLQAVGDDQHIAENVLSYINGLKAGMLMASADKGDKKTKTRNGC